ncbi:MAG: JAB domain-containing protein [Candidatus Pseudobacter hemicellulosilyticus]|uniref:JAB domain-containing protein n=1 Tax=Candidatus Pseudobacter hemicellulosilyticus TaxID=3121375 RepID=A0AAJ6BGG4_9BACT|nr:MAG: JAB domain-containing protein [Pseudobacter sp.]
METTNFSIDCSRVAEIEIKYVRQEISPVKIVNSRLAYQLFRQNWDQGNLDFIEELKVAYLTSGQRVLAIHSLYKGGIDAVHVDLRPIFAAALKLCATSIILAHNHPSANAKPSIQDVNLTNKIRQAGDLLNIPLNDHIIVTRDGYYSFLDEGLI